jgi:hypothetical protein
MGQEQRWIRQLASRTVPLPRTGVAPVKIHCSILAEDAIKAAMNDYKKKRLTAAACVDQPSVYFGAIDM